MLKNLNMKKIVRLTELDLTRIVKRVIMEQNNTDDDEMQGTKCREGDCEPFLHQHMKNFPNYNIVDNGDGRKFYQGKNSRGEKVSILIPIKNATNLDMFIKGKQLSFKLPESMIGSNDIRRWKQYVK